MIVVKYPAIGLNHSQKITTRGKYPRLVKTKERKAFDSFCKLTTNLHARIVTAECYEVHINIYKPRFVTAKGTASLKGGDIDGFIKPILDEIFNNLGQDDSKIFKLVTNKILSKDDYFTINIIPRCLKDFEE